MEEERAVKRKRGEQMGEHKKRIEFVHSTAAREREREREREKKEKPSAGLAGIHTNGTRMMEGLYV